MTNKGLISNRGAEQRSKTEFREAVKATLAQYLLSASGWRKLFAVDGRENSTKSELSAADRALVFLAAQVIGTFFREQAQSLPQQRKKWEIVLAQDSRPTGEAMGQWFQAAFKQAQLPYVWLGITALPEAMAFTALQPSAVGLAYLSASHNPAGYNGIKVVDAAGKVLAEREAAVLIQRFKRAAHQLESRQSLQGPPLKTIIKTPAKQRAEQHYRSRLQAILLGRGEEELASGVRQKEQAMLHALKQTLRAAAVKIVCDFNGSARLTSLDLKWLTELGVETASLNHQLGKFSHRIVPEGAALRPVASWLGAHPRENYFLGWVVDCDGDRGNFVFPAPQSAKKNALVPQAQITFALAVLAELSFLSAFYPERLRRLALIVNGPTSLIIDHLAELYGAAVFRCEVGEANVLALAEEKRQAGYCLHIVGEGSNGGNITFPSTVRDPLASVGALLKLFFLRAPVKKPHSAPPPTLLWLAAQRLKLKLPAEASYGESWQALINRLSIYSSTAVFEKRALMQLAPLPLPLLKRAYEAEFELFFRAPEHQARFKRYGFATYQFVNYEGTKEKWGKGNRSGLQDGGLMALFLDQKKNKRGFVWWRPSKTEPVCRLSAEVLGPPAAEKWLLKEQRKLLVRSGLGAKSNAKSSAK